jgi:pantothenate kinase
MDRPCRKARASEEVTVGQYAQELIRAGWAREDGPRFLLGITGIPAARKSAFAALLAATLNRVAGKEVAVVVPMDGFHLPNVVLEERGLRAVKGCAGYLGYPFPKTASKMALPVPSPLHLTSR